MYWINLVLFVAIVFVPEFVRHGVGILPENTVEELFLFGFGMLWFGLFMFREKQLEKTDKERSKNQRSLNQLSKDLNTSYSYIGESNRKLDILKSIILGISAGERLTEKKCKELLYVVLQSAQLLARSNRVMLRFIQENDDTILKEIKNDPELVFNLAKEDAQKLNGKGHVFWENKDCFVFAARGHSLEVKAMLVVFKDASHHNIEDIEILKTLVSYALFIFSHCELMHRKNRNA